MAHVAGTAKAGAGAGAKAGAKAGAGVAHVAGAGAKAGFRGAARDNRSAPTPSTESACDPGHHAAVALALDADALVAGLAHLDPARLTPGACARLATVLARTANACTAAAARLAARAPEPAVGRAEWFARVSGGTTDQARRALDTVTALPPSSPTGTALCAGEVSVAQAEAIASAPGHEDELLRTARDGSLRSVRDAARAHRLADADPDLLAVRQRAARSFSHWTDDLGMVCFRGALPPVEGTAFVNRLDALTDRLTRAAWRSAHAAPSPRPPHGGTNPPDRTGPEPRAAYAADAFVLLHTPGDPPPDSVAPRPGRSTVEVVIVADLAALRRGRALPGEQCGLLGGSTVPVATVRDLVDDAFVKAVLHDGTRIHTVAHYGRNRPAHLRTALMLGPAPEFPGTVCAHPGCDRRHRLEWDHVRPLSRGGPTSLANLQPLCPAHHREKTRNDARTPRPGPGP